MRMSTCYLPGGEGGEEEEGGGGGGGGKGGGGGGLPCKYNVWLLIVIHSFLLP